MRKKSDENRHDRGPGRGSAPTSASGRDGEATRDRILFLLKTRGPERTAAIAARLGCTPMGARQHLALLQEDGLVDFEARRRGGGRPARWWRLTPAGQARFPQGYAELTVELLGNLRRAFGARGLERLVAARTRQQRRDYSQRLPIPSAPLAGRVAALARLRRAEGYMADWRRQRDGSYLLVENHCPICAAAQVCQGLCAGELELFQRVLGNDVVVERTEHLLAGARRCAYRIARAAS
jgi:predicted ArsR family transcriptional regulator